MADLMSEVSEIVHHVRAETANVPRTTRNVSHSLIVRRRKKLRGGLRFASPLSWALSGLRVSWARWAGGTSIFLGEREPATPSLGSFSARSPRGSSFTLPRPLLTHKSSS